MTAPRKPKPKGLRLKPHEKSGEPGWWWYEEPKGIRVVLSSDFTGHRSLHVTIRWNAIRNALARKDNG
jgi:hypothetical protein